MDNKKIIIHSAQAGLRLQKFDGSFPAGTNGPWKHKVTQVRNTAHWAYLIYTAFLISKENKFRNAAIKACDYLLLPKLRPGDATFYCRISPETKLKSNGLIGQAWAIEPLIFIGKHEKKQEYLDLAEKILTIHPFNRRKGLYESVDIDGSSKGINGTLNQQIWFAAISLYYCKTKGLRKGKLYINAKECLKKITHKIDIYEDGCIKHSIKKSFKSCLKQYIFKYFKKELSERNDIIHSYYSQRELSVGYHSFILAGISMAFNNYPDLQLWKKLMKNKKTQKAIRYSFEAIKNSDKESGFAFQYNPTGIENAFFWQTFSNCPRANVTQEYFESAIMHQLNKHYDYDSSLMNKRTVDPDTLSARIYELAYLMDLKNYKH